MKEVFKELGKHLLNIAVAIIVFAILQPIIHKEFDVKLAISFMVVYIAVVVVASIFIFIGGDKNE